MQNIVVECALMITWTHRASRSFYRKQQVYQEWELEWVEVMWVLLVDKDLHCLRALVL